MYTQNKSWRKNICWVCETIQFQEFFFDKSFKILYIIVQWIDLWKILKKIFILKIWIKHEEETAFQNLNVGKNLKWNILITKFHKS